MRDHGEALEADLQRYYQVTLSDLFAGRLSWRRLNVLVTQLPRESAVAAAQYGEATAWGAIEHLLAGCLDALNQIIWQNGAGRGRRPRAITRPGTQTPALGRTALPPARLRAYLDQFKPPEAQPCPA